MPAHSPIRTYSARELAALAGISPRTIESYRRAKILEVHARGRGARYTETDLHRVLVLRQLFAKGYTMKHARDRLRSMTPAELAKAAGAGSAAAPSSQEGRDQAGEHWQVFTLAPGVVLGVGAALDEEAKRVADEILRLYR